MEDKKDKIPLLTKFLLRLVIGLFLLLVICYLDKEEIISIDNFKEHTSENINFANIALKINGKINLIDMGTKEEQTVSNEVMDLETGKEKKILSSVYEEIESKVCGVVVKIRKENGFYETTILGVDDSLYTYAHLSTIDVYMYQYITKGKTIGKSEEYYIIKKD